MMADTLRIVVLCIAAAMVCASIRVSHPQVASAVALAAGALVMILSTDYISEFAQSALKIQELAECAGGDKPILKVCGIAMIAEFASDICRDAGEAALSRRIDFAVKIGITAVALPMAMDIMNRIVELMP